MDQDRAQPQAVPPPGVPADHGLSTLALLMQLGGMLFAAFMCLGIFTAIVKTDGRLNSGLGWMILILGSCAARSLFHRAAGTEILYGNRRESGGSPLGGLKRYIIIALVHSVLIGIFLFVKWKTGAKAAFAIAAAFALWPALLGTLLLSGRFRHLAKEVPVAEDKGFEGASILMTVMGVIGTLIMGFFFLMLLKEGDKLLSSGYGILILGAVGMLAVRSILHAQAGFSGLRETSLERSVDRANRYANFGVIASFSAAGAMLLISMQGAVHLLMFVVVALVCWMLLVWPLIIRRFFSDRQFADLLAGDGASVHRRAPDAGLTGLGWFLFSTAALSASMLLPRVILGVNTQFMSEFDTLQNLFGGQVGTRSIWFNVGLLMLQGWAGYELIRMSPAHKIIATVFGLVAAGVTLYQWYPMLELLKNLSDLGGGFERIAMSYLPLAIALLVPVTTIVLVNRKIAPMAMARFRR